MLIFIERLLLMFVMVALMAIGVHVAGAANLTVYCAMTDEDCRAGMQAFEADTGIHASFVRMGAGEIVARVRAEKDNPQAALWFTSPADNFIQAKREGLIAPYKAAGIEDIDPAIRDAEHYWIPIAQSPMIIVYSEKILAETGAPAPTGWQSFADPAYKAGGIALAHPASSGTAYTMLSTLVQIFGEDEAFELMKRMDANVVQYTRSGIAPSRMVANNEIALAVTYLQDVEAPLAQGYQFGYLFPQEGDGFELNASALIANAPEEQRGDAQTFLDWILTENGQRFMASTFRAPIKPGLTNPKAQIDISNIKLIDYDFVWAGENRARLLERYDREIRRGEDVR